MAKVRDRIRADVLAEALEARREELISTGVAEIQDRMEAYRQADAALLEDVTRHIGQHHDLLCAVLRRGRPAAAREFEFVGRHAALRAARDLAAGLPGGVSQLSQRALGRCARRLAEQRRGGRPGADGGPHEGITPAVHQGEPLVQRQPIGTFNRHSIEIGFALGQGDLALAHNVYHEGADTAAGRAMNQLLTSLGAPAGHEDMVDCGGPCPIMGGSVPRLAGTLA